ncbi:hypothetical protein [Leisingera sp. ANG-Vp]|uniref:hypothetical protein n=1 Tax=Leisingera sp. ANG-Vp TaxID=1577896 RepID=UPI00057F717B|nr:hypothetical protein [Leisingera sp. ANG-Vp]KIC14750.1 hypothetical protein RA20_19715 [Leisingera sp. ANG-Vp]
MAWVSAVSGALGGLVLAVAAGIFGGWPVWLILLLYPFTAAALMLIVLAFLYWRQSRLDSKRSGGQSTAASAMPRNLGADLY